MGSTNDEIKESFFNAGKKKHFVGTRLCTYNRNGKLKKKQFLKTDKGNMRTKQFSGGER